MEMNNEYFGIATTPMDDYLAHYGVKGMKWGVRRALGRGSERALGRQYRKAQKKLAKLEKRASSGKKYARRAAVLGAGAAAAGGLAALGTAGVGKGLGKASDLARKVAPGVGNAMVRVGDAARKSNIKMIRDAGRATAKAGRAVRTSGAGNRTSAALGTAGEFVKGWGSSNSISKGAAESIYKAAGKGKSQAASLVRKNAAKLRRSGVSNDTIARIGAGAVGAGLGAGAAYNAYRAATTKRAAKKAQQFRSEMNKAFAGTKYANGSPSGQKKRRRR